MIRAGIRRAFRLAVGGRRHWERDVEEEIKLHLALRAEQLVAGGTPSDEAFAEAVRRFGPLAESRARLLDAARHREQRMQRTEYFADLRQDLSFALRTLRRQKAWTAVTLATLALGVGATTAVFSVVSSLMLHALPYPGGDRLVYVYQQPSTGNNTGVPVTIIPSGSVIQAWKSGSRSFEALEAFGSVQMSMRTSGAPSSVNVTRIEPTFPGFADRRVVAGRMFSTSDMTGGGRVVMLGEQFWRARFGSDSKVIGRAITLDDSLYTVVGVLPTTLQSPRVGGPPTDVWLPLDIREGGGGMLIGRLRRGVGPATAARELDSLFARTTGFSGGKIPYTAVVVAPAEHLRFHDSLVMLTFAVALVLLIACANVAHLLMARSAGRQRELAIRTALGAGRWRVLRQLLTESLIIAGGGTLVGVLAGWVGMKILIAFRPPSLPELAAAHLDATTLWLAVAVAIVTAVLFGAMGARQAWRQSTSHALKDTATNLSPGGRTRARLLLIVSEMALSATLVVGATMLIRSVVNLQHADLGFEPAGLYSLRVGGTSRSHLPVARSTLMRTIATRLSTMPGIQSVALTGSPPQWRSFIVSRLEIEGEPTVADGSTSFIDEKLVGRRYFQTMGIRLVQGTEFTDTTRTSRQVIVNAGFARKQWPNTSAVGRRVRIALKSVTAPWLTIVGVADDALPMGPMSESSAPLLYFPGADSTLRAMMLRTDGAADPLTAVRALVRSVDPGLTPTLESVQEQVARSIAAPRFVMLLLSSFTILALVLAAIGLYGVMSHTVAERTREIGIRVALGATRGRIARRLIGGGVVLALAGSLAGVATAAGGTRLIEHQLYGVARSDAASFVAAILILLAVAIIACIVPTRRALAVDPMTAIRAE